MVMAVKQLPKLDIISAATSIIILQAKTPTKESNNWKLFLEYIGQPRGFTPLGMMGAQLRAFLKPLGTISLWCSRAPTLGLSMIPRGVRNIVESPHEPASSPKTIRKKTSTTFFSTFCPTVY